MRNRMIKTNSVFPGNHAATMRFPTVVVMAVMVILLMSLGAGGWDYFSDRSSYDYTAAD